MSDVENHCLLGVDCCTNSYTTDQYMKSRIKELEALTDAEQLGLLAICDEYKRKMKMGKSSHDRAIVTDITKGILVAAVPIITTLGLASKGDKIKWWGSSFLYSAFLNSTTSTGNSTQLNANDGTVDLGACLHFAAVVLGFIIVVIHVYQASSMGKQNAQRDIMEASKTETELTTYLAGAGAYDPADRAGCGFHQYTDDVDTSLPDYDAKDESTWKYNTLLAPEEIAKRQYRLFVATYQVIRATSLETYANELNQAETLQSLETVVNHFEKAPQTATKGGKTQKKKSPSS
jgi:hypothetical protein